MGQAAELSSPIKVGGHKRNPREPDQLSFRLPKTSTSLNVNVIIVKFMKSSVFLNLLIVSRPRQWVKNLFLFAPLLFSKSFTNTESVWLSFLGFVSFCLAASATYLVNDLIDIKEDQHHPTKRFRPIASGAISKRAAITTSVVLFIAAILISSLLHPTFVMFVCLYVALNLFYSLSLKNIPILDVMCIALGFVIRVLAGAVPLDLPFSSWLIASTFFLTLTLAIYKSSNEQLHMVDTSRPVLKYYNQAFLRQIGTIAATLALMTYTLYTWNTGHSFAFIITIPFAVYGVLRYLLIMEHKATTDDGPIDDLFKDRPLQVSIILWIVTTAVILVWYG